MYVSYAYVPGTKPPKQESLMLIESKNPKSEVEACPGASPTLYFKPNKANGASTSELKLPCEANGVACSEMKLLCEHWLAVGGNPIGRDRGGSGG